MPKRLWLPDESTSPPLPPRPSLPAPSALPLPTLTADGRSSNVATPSPVAADTAPDSGHGVAVCGSGCGVASCRSARLVVSASGESKSGFSRIATRLRS
eukprot:363618-Chlamydomonas_euryale.AAC.18